MPSSPSSLSSLTSLSRLKDKLSVLEKEEQVDAVAAEEDVETEEVQIAQKIGIRYTMMMKDIHSEDSCISSNATTATAVTTSPSSESAFHNATNFRWAIRLPPLHNNKEPSVSPGTTTTDKGGGTYSLLNSGTTNTAIPSPSLSLSASASPTPASASASAASSAVAVAECVRLYLLPEHTTPASVSRQQQQGRRKTKTPPPHPHYREQKDRRKKAKAGAGEKQEEDDEKKGEKEKKKDTTSYLGGEQREKEEENRRVAEDHHRWRGERESSNSHQSHGDTDDDTNETDMNDIELVHEALRDTARSAAKARRQQEYSLVEHALSVSGSSSSTGTGAGDQEKTRRSRGIGVLVSSPGGSDDDIDDDDENGNNEEEDGEDEDEDDEGDDHETTDKKDYFYVRDHQYHYHHQHLEKEQNKQRQQQGSKLNDDGDVWGDSIMSSSASSLGNVNDDNGDLCKRDARPEQGGGREGGTGWGKEKEEEGWMGRRVATVYLLCRAVEHDPTDERALTTLTLFLNKMAAETDHVRPGGDGTDTGTSSRVVEDGDKVAAAAGCCDDNKDEKADGSSWDEKSKKNNSNTTIHDDESNRNLIRSQITSQTLRHENEKREKGTKKLKQVEDSNLSTSTPAATLQGPPVPSHILQEVGRGHQNPAAARVAAQQQQEKQRTQSESQQPQKPDDEPLLRRQHDHQYRRSFVPRLKSAVYDPSAGTYGYYNEISKKKNNNNVDSGGGGNLVESSSSTSGPSVGRNSSSLASSQSSFSSSSVTAPCSSCSTNQERWLLWSCIRYLHQRAMPLHPKYFLRCMSNLSSTSTDSVPASPTSTTTTAASPSSSSTANIPRDSTTTTRSSPSFQNNSPSVAGYASVLSAAMRAQAKGWFRLTDRQVHRLSRWAAQSTSCLIQKRVLMLRAAGVAQPTWADVNVNKNPNSRNYSAGDVDGESSNRSHHDAACCPYIIMDRNVPVPQFTLGDALSIAIGDWCEEEAM